MGAMVTVTSVAPSGSGMVVTFTPVLSDAMRKSVAILFLLFAHCARAALAETG